MEGTSVELMFDRISLEPSRFCSKGCSFCYNGSSSRGQTGFTATEVIELARDCAANGVKFLSIGGGEPLEWPGLLEVLQALRGVLGRSFTTNGLPLVSQPGLFDEIARVAPDKVHVSIHAAENAREVSRVCAQVLELERRGVPAGVNLLVRKSQLEAARSAAVTLQQAGLVQDQIVFLPSRGIPGETPSAAEVAWVATGQRASSAPFKSMSCLNGCAKSERFVSIGADRTVAWCSYTVSRGPLRGLRHADILAALVPDPGLIPCERALVRSARPG